MQDLRTLAAPEMQGRLTGSDGNSRARQLIIERFKALALQPVNGSFEQSFSFVSTRGGEARSFPSASNVVGLIPGTSNADRYIVVGAHYDHLGARDSEIFHGADDNASGVAALLSLAAWFSRHRPPTSLLLVGFDAEEHGLQGARHFVATPPVPIDRIAAMINMDMVGRGDAGTLTVAGTHPHPELKPLVEAAAAGRGLSVAFGHDRPAAEAKGRQDWTNLSDHGPFHAAGIPYLYFGVEDHADYHKPTDIADKIPRRFYLEATEVVLDTVRRLAERLAK